jgi:hypothetical protein
MEIRLHFLKIFISKIFCLIINFQVNLVLNQTKSLLFMNLKFDKNILK